MFVSDICELISEGLNLRVLSRSPVYPAKPIVTLKIKNITFLLYRKAYQENPNSFCYCSNATIIISCRQMKMDKKEPDFEQCGHFEELHSPPSPSLSPWEVSLSSASNGYFRFEFTKFLWRTKMKTFYRPLAFSCVQSK